MPNLSTRDNDLYRIGHMVEFCQKLVTITATASEEILEDDWIKTYAIMELLQLLGEAASKVSDEVKKQSPDIPWAQAKLLRNRLIHGYDDIDYRQLWEGLEDDIPPMLEQLHTLDRELRSSSAQ